MYYQKHWKVCVVFVTILNTIHFINGQEQEHHNTTSSRSKRQTGCSNRDEFQCKTGQCISRLKLCDGIKHCSDGSDEVEEQCRLIECPDSRFTFRCEYGACISRSLRCNGKRDCRDGSDEIDCSVQDGCYLPQHVPFGTFNITTGSRYVPNLWVPSSTTIHLFCNKNTGNRQQFFYCHKNEWRPPLIDAKCENPDTCPSLKTSTSEEVVCRLRDEQVSCQEPVNNTTVRVRCQMYHIFDGVRPIYRCENGNWDQIIPPCTPECGLKSVAATELIIDGQETAEHEYPWVAGIYNSTDHHICGATIISRYFVLSAAHCFTNTQDGTPKAKESYTIVSGKHYRELNVVEKSVQKRKIKTMYIHEDYRGMKQKYRDDIALIELDVQLSISLETQPVCIDWSNSFEDFDFIEGKEGIVAGWGKVQATGDQSAVLKKLIVPFRNKTSCVTHLPPDFYQEFYTSDKICAGYHDREANVCSGDSGGGLIFRSDGKKFYLRGIVSIAVKSEIGCDAKQYALYTRVSNYLKWLESKTRRVV